MSFVELLDDDHERNRLNNYIDWAGIKDYQDFKNRVNNAFDTPQGRALLNAMTESNMQKWFKAEQDKVNQYKTSKPIDGKQGKFGRDYFLGTNRGGDIFAVRKAEMKNKYGKTLIKYRDAKGMFASLRAKGETHDTKTGRFKSNFEPSELSWHKGRKGGALRSKSKKRSSKGELSSKRSGSELKSRRRMKEEDE